MFAHIISTLALVAIYATTVTATALPSQPAAIKLEARDVQADSKVALTKRCGGGGCGCGWGCGCGYGGYGGIGGYGGYGGFGGYSGMGGFGGYGIAGISYV
ncbi:hypothetical protein IWW39_000042 [Coemansia spiralis]|uniref:Uncharacterized protein n=1 Tax=Coemansia spiralis TaxID=417178 RepID=A0A9W8GSW8_9FUNG|nr:hypothetical protein IWW39_000042 [Coemansia spiralis]